MILQILFILLLTAAANCFAADAMPSVRAAGEDGNVHIHADRMNQESSKGIYTAEGNVVVLWQGMHLNADRASYEPSKQLLHAEGSVVMKKGSSTLRGGSLTMNLETGLAEMERAFVHDSASGVNIMAEKIVRTGDDEFKSTNAELTACELPDPSWKFSAERLNVNLLGYATARNVVFYVKKVPLLYIPWIAFPATLEKRSGLLFPKAGYSKDKGARLDLPIYWVISPNHDLQFDLDIMTRRGVGTGLDYRYIRKRGSEGHLAVYSIYDQVENRWRGQLAQEHREIFSTSMNLRSNINLESDRGFLSVYGESAGDYNRQSNTSTVNLLKTWQNVAMTGHLKYSEDLYGTSNSSTLQTLPSIGLSAVRSSILNQPLYFDLDASAEHLYRETGTTGQRLYLFPRLSLTPLSGGAVKTTLYAGVHARGYSTDRHNAAGVKESDGTLLPEAGIRASAPFSRVYQTDFDTLKKMRHELIPEISYSYLPEQSQGRLPFYDLRDRFIHQNMIALSATSVLNGKFTGKDISEYRDISRIRLEARYSLAGEQRDLLTLGGNQLPWSDLILESETTLTKLLKTTFDARYNMKENQLSAAVVGIDYDDRHGTSAGLGYQMARSEVEYIEGRISTKRIIPFRLSYTGRYSLDRKDFLEAVYAAEYRDKCWGLNFAISQRPGNSSFTLHFTLAGL